MPCLKRFDIVEVFGVAHRWLIVGSVFREQAQGFIEDAKQILSHTPQVRWWQAYQVPCPGAKARKGTFSVAAQCQRHDEQVCDVNDRGPQGGNSGPHRIVVVGRHFTIGLWQLPQCHEGCADLSVVAPDDRALDLVERCSAASVFFESDCCALWKFLVKDETSDVVKQPRDKEALGIAFPTKRGQRSGCDAPREAMLPERLHRDQVGVYTAELGEHDRGQHQIVQLARADDSNRLLDAFHALWETVEGAVGYA